MRRKQEDSHSGSSFDDFLKKEGLQNEIVVAASSRVIAWQREQEMIRTRAPRKTNVTPARKTSHA